MPPKKTVPTKAPSKPSGAKAAPTKTGTPTKGKGATTTKTAATQNVQEKEAAKPEVVPKQIELKELAGLISRSGPLGEEYVKSNKWPLIIDSDGNSGTFFKYRDANNLFTIDIREGCGEKVRLSVLGALRYGKPVVLQLEDSDYDGMVKIMTQSLATMAIYKDRDLFADIYSREILKEECYKKLYDEKTDSREEYQNFYEYRTQDFQFIVLVKNPPSQEVMQNHFVLQIPAKEKSSK